MTTDDMARAHRAISQGWRFEAAKQYRRWLINIIGIPLHKAEFADCVAVMNLVITENAAVIALVQRRGKLTKGRTVAFLVNKAQKHHQRKTSSTPRP